MGPTWFIEPSFNYSNWGREWQLLDMRDKLVASLLPAWPLLTLCWLRGNISWAAGHYLTMFCQPAAAAAPSYYPIISELLRHRAVIYIRACFRVASSGRWWASMVTPANEDGVWCQQIVMRLTLSVTLDSGEWSPHHVTRCRDVTQADICDTIPGMTRSRGPMSVWQQVSVRL